MNLRTQTRPIFPIQEVKESRNELLLSISVFFNAQAHNLAKIMFFYECEWK